MDRRAFFATIAAAFAGRSAVAALPVSGIAIHREAFLSPVFKRGFLAYEQILFSRKWTPDLDIEWQKRKIGDVIRVVKPLARP